MRDPRCSSPLRIAMTAHRKPASTGESTRQSARGSRMLRMPGLHQLPVPMDMSLFDFAPVAHMVLDAAGIVLHIDAAGCAMLGTARQHVIRLPFRRWIAAEQSTDFLEHLRRCRLDERVESHFRIAAADGGRVPTRWYSRYTSFRGEPIIPTVVLDVTEQIV